MTPAEESIREEFARRVDTAKRVLGEGGYRQFVKPWLDELRIMLAVERETIANLQRQIDELESLARCNAPSPTEEGTGLCDLWPGHDGRHMNAAGYEWRTSATKP